MRALDLDGLRAKFRAVHGAKREEVAFSLALLRAATSVAREATARRESWEYVFERERTAVELLWRLEHDDWERAKRAGTLAPDQQKPPRKSWNADTWRALACFAEARATEEEWYAIVAQCARSAAVARAAVRPPRVVVTYGNDGLPRMFHVQRTEESEDK